MPKRIAVSPHLDSVRRVLEQNGFHTVGVDETQQAIHALVYSASTGAQGNEAHTTNLSISGNNKFVIMINADEYTPEEIVDMIN